MRKFVLLFVIFVAMAASSVSAQSIEVSAQSMFRSKYVGPDGLAFYEKPVVQSNITFEHKSGLYLDLWVSTGLDAKWVNGDWGDEIDYTLGWSGKVSKFNLDVAVIYFDDAKLFYYPFNDAIMGNITLELPIEVSKKFSLSPYAKFTPYYIPDKKTPFSGGNLYSLGSNSEINLTKVLKATPSAQLTYDTGAFDLKPGMLLNLSASLALEVSDKATWNVVELVEFFPLGDRDLMKSEFTIGTGLSWSF